MNSLLRVTDVGEVTGYSNERIFDLVREGRFPLPVDPELHARSWRWSPVAIDAYVAGQWSAAQPDTN